MNISFDRCIFEISSEKQSRLVAAETTNALCLRAGYLFRCHRIATTCMSSPWHCNSFIRGQPRLNPLTPITWQLKNRLFKFGTLIGSVIIRIETPQLILCKQWRQSPTNAKKRPTCFVIYYSFRVRIILSDERPENDVRHKTYYTFFFTFHFWTWKYSKQMIYQKNQKFNVRDILRNVRDLLLTVII